MKKEKERNKAVRAGVKPSAVQVYLFILKLVSPQRMEEKCAKMRLGWLGDVKAVPVNPCIQAVGQ